MAYLHSLTLYLTLNIIRCTIIYVLKNRKNLAKCLISRFPLFYILHGIYTIWYSLLYSLIIVLISI